MEKASNKFLNQVVLLDRGFIGVCKWVGIFPDDEKKTIYFGIKLGEGTGEGNGSYKGVQYFQAPPNKAMFVSGNSIKRIITAEALLGKVVTLNKKLKSQKVEISKLTDELTLSRNNAEVPKMSSGTSPHDSNDNSDQGIRKFCEQELTKRWYISLPDLQTRFHGRESADVGNVYSEFESRFSDLPEAQPHGRIVYSVCASARDNLIGSGSDDKSIRLWRRKDKKLFCVSNITLRSCINSLAISPDGSILAAALDSGWIELYDLGTGKMIGALEGQTTSEVWTICFSPDGQNIISGALDRAVRIWDVHNRECRWALRGHDEWVNGVAVSPDGSSIVSGSGDKTVRVWDTKSMTCRSTLPVTPTSSGPSCVLQDSKTIVSASDDTTLRVWDSDSQKIKTVLKAHSKGIYSVAAGVGNQIASASRDATVKVWDVNQARPLKSYNAHKGDVNSCTFFDKGRWVASGSDDKTVKIYEI